MVRGGQWRGGLLALLTAVLAVGWWYASAHEELPSPEGTPHAQAPAAPEGGDSQERARQEADAFAREALEKLRAAGFKGELRYEPERFQIQVPEAEGQQAQTIFLGNFYGEYRSAPPERRAEAMRRMLVLGRAPSAPVTYEAAREALLPVVRPRAYFELLRLEGPEPPGEDTEPASWRPLGDALAVALVQDTPEAMRYLGEKDFTQWGVTFEEATAQALENLRRQSREALIPLAPGTCVSPWRDSYATSRMLLEEVLRGCPVRGEPVALVPHRDLLILTGSRDEEGLARAAELALEAYQAPRPVDGRALRRTPQGWVPFLPERDSKAWPTLRKLQVMSQALEYASQREGLDARHMRQEVDLFVAAFVPLYDDEQGRSVSQSVWVKGIDMLLPRADLLFLMDSALGPEAPPLAVVRWDVVQRDTGELLAPVPGLYPERYRPKGFPSEEQIERWKKDPSTGRMP